MKFSEKEIIVGVIFLIIFVALSVNLFWANPSNVNFCGDGVCVNNEIGACSIDCDWCGDGYCQEGESCSSCKEDCNSCSSEFFCGDGVCSVGECNSGCWKDCGFLECENGICELEKGESCINSPNDCRCIDGYCDSESGQCIYQSCGNGVCDVDETYLNCPNDCKEIYEVEDTSDINYPIILVHGHSATSSSSENSINTFKEFQEKLDSEGYADSKGIVLPKDMDIAEGSWGKTRKPIVVRTTYYLNAYDEFGSTIGPEDNQHINTYAKRLSGVVYSVLKYTEKNKVIIIAHSMGGLVSREYVKNEGGLNKVDKLVTIGTPNHGIYADISTNCEGVFGRTENSPECEDMRVDSVFITQLNQQETFTNIDYMTITGKATNEKVDYGYLIGSIFPYSVCDGGEYHDEVVCVSSVFLNGAINKIVNGQEVSGKGTFHGDMTEPSRVPEVYDYVVDFLDL